ncbi:MazG nucleotide pyrophosphohydrolase domain-containing protein [Alkaliphilus hydrothermalis]|uniref:MazG nucleotide pyrophosphohydrolase domain-containing protein n=1 Tax=Alkaliphilus hydrothermalis TaxID=1482730 RepID=UPI00195EBBBE
MRVLDLVSEVGEISKEVLKATSYGKKPLELHKDKFSEEMGDALFSLICVANNSDIDLADCLLRVLEKYQTRIDEKGNPASNK